MRRYFFYIIIMNMLVNVIAFVPDVLIYDRFHGAVSSMLLSIPVELVMMYIFMKSIACFPGKGLPEIIGILLPSWAGKLVLVLIGAIWYLGGLLILLIITDISIRYINPETIFYIGILMFLVVVCKVIRYKSFKIAYLFEMILILNLPLILVIVIKAYVSRTFNWDAVWVVGTAVTQLPKWRDFAAASFVFSGYANMIIFNRIFPKPIGAGSVWIAGLVGTAVLLTTMMIPIAYQGADGVADYTYPWITTADSMRMELGVVERVLYVFLLLYAGISLGNIIIRWHITLELIQAALPRLIQSGKWGKWTGRALLALLSLTALIFGFFFNETLLQYWANTFLEGSFISECLVVGLVAAAAVRSKRA